MELNQADIAGKSIAWLDTGNAETGIPLILIHCSSASHKAWRAFIDSLPLDKFRVLAPDLYGYGKSQKYASREPYDATVDRQIIKYLRKIAGKPSHLLGHSYGAAMCMEVLRENPDDYLSAFLIEPVCFHLLEHHQEHLTAWKHIQNVANRTIRYCNQGRSLKATREYMSYWLGLLAWWLMPWKNKVKFAASIEKVSAEFASMYDFHFKQQDYAHINTPISLLYGEKTTREAKMIIHLLQDALVNANSACLEKAGHLCLLTHPQEVNALIHAHLQKIGAETPESST